MNMTSLIELLIDSGFFTDNILQSIMQDMVATLVEIVTCSIGP